MYELLARTSRTFALAIPLLPEPTRGSMCLAYLLFRIADTLEDAPTWPRLARLHALDQWAELLEAPDRAEARALCERWLREEPTPHDGYRDLLAAAPDLLDTALRLRDDTRRTVLSHALRTARGMRATLEGADDAGNVKLVTLDELRGYCYTVAGIVGELITELFVQDAPGLLAVRKTLLEHQLAFGEGLQLVNILKDEKQDAGEGRVYLPAAVPRAEVLALARAGLVRAWTYIEALKVGAAPAGFVAFTSLCAELADATLDLLEQRGAGAKVPRDRVAELYERHHRAVSLGADVAHSASAHSGK